MSDLVAGALRGEARALARLLTLLEGEWDTSAGDAMRQLAPRAGQAHVIGITGPPGAGKSTLVDRLIAAFREGGLGRVAVLAFDPSSPYTGGALLGDRVRMGSRALDPGVYIRSVANRAHAGGLSRTAARLVTALDAAGYSPILLETVGAGQSEVEVATLAQTVLVVVAPGFGDEVQALKAGILETADLFVVNKADLPGAERLAASLAEHAARGGRELQEAIPVYQVCAASGAGVAELAAALVARGEKLRGSETWQGRRRLLARRLLEEALREGLWRRFETEHAPALATFVERVARGELDPESAAERLLNTRADAF